MIQTASLPTARQHALRKSDRTFPQPFQTLWTWYRRSHSRYQLSQASAHILADIGITEAQRNAEVSKPFWRV